MAYKRYIAINSVGGYLYYFFIFAPLYASQNGISLQSAGWIFSIVYAVQAVLSYTVGRIFEKFSPNLGVILARGIFSLGPLILFFGINPMLFTLAMILASFFDVFFPSLILFERAIFPPDKRETIYRWIIFLSESVKLAFITTILLIGLRISKNLFLTQFLAAIIFMVLFYLLMPKVSSGSVIKGGEVKINRKNLFFIYMSQSLVLLAFNLAGWMFKSYYLNDILRGSTKDLLISEVFFSSSILLLFLLIKNQKIKLKSNLMIGTILMSIFFFVMAIPKMGAFFISHAIIGSGFFLWQPAKDALKFQNAPEELGRWEGFFQGVNIFSRIFFPPLAAFIATRLSYPMVYVTAGIISSMSVFFVAGVKE